MSALDRLIEDARRAEPDPLDDGELRRIRERAALTGRARHRSWTRRRLMTVAGLAGAVAAAVVTVAWHERSTYAEVSETALRTEPAKVTDLELPTGDRIVAAAGARFEVDVPEGADRRVRLDLGSMLFDVRPIEGGRFSVATPGANVLVLGTVFTVHASERGTTVYVYEGRIEMRSADRVRIVTAGGVAHFGEGEPLPDALETRGVDAARERTALAGEGSEGEAPVARASDDEPVLAEASPSEPASAVRVEAPAAPAPEPLDPSATSGDDATVSEVRAWIASGDAARALAVAQHATSAGQLDPWRMLEADALRALGHTRDAADTYRRAAAELAPPRRQQAGFVEARLRAMELGDPEGALVALRDAAVTAEGSPLRERGLALEARLLQRLGRDAERAELARSYLRDYPDGPEADAMRELVSSERR